ncbi:hypothetical protein Trco_006768 [Trichoderma cornu-damae]|uniref:Fibronectin type-III domain-containing protein n=1 Tax=Trichoderma cornu-damae TaxID=654480 RepID=A0A9P8TRZ4_9HYPO|nr:hypothetical protein Trco_006768 [Trichoderma cornu-damae]
MGNDTDPITRPSLGQDVQLGMLYDSRKETFFAGISLWDSEEVNKIEVIDENKVQNASTVFSYSTEDARKAANLDIEGSLSLELSIIQAKGSAKYLSDKKSSTFEARVDVSSTVTRRTRRIPQETLAKLKYDKYLDDDRFTHFVAEVVEGGSATLSFVQSCSSSEELTKISGELEVTIVKIPIGGKAKVEYTKEEKAKLERFTVSYSGAIVESVSNLEDALRVAHDMPQNLKKQMNTLSYQLLPISLLDSKANRVIRALDANLVSEVVDALKDGATVQLGLRDVKAQKPLEDWFPKVKKQIANFQRAFDRAETEFKSAARRLLPELRDGNTDEKSKIEELRSAVALFRKRIGFATEFIEKKLKEARTLDTTVASLLANGFEDHITKYPDRSVTSPDAPWLMLVFGGGPMALETHPLQQKVEEKETKPPPPVGGSAEDGDGDNAAAAAADDDDDDDDDDEEEEWFEDQEVVSRLKASCASLQQQRVRAAPGVIFGVANIPKAHRLGKKKAVLTKIGDTVLDNEGKLLIITGMLPTAMQSPTLASNSQSLTVNWDYEQDQDQAKAIPIKGFVVTYGPRENTLKDSPLPRKIAYGTYEEVQCDVSETSTVLNGLHDDCDYEVKIAVKSIVGWSEDSKPAIGRTAKLPSVASRMIDFYNENKTTLSEPGESRKPWDLYASGGRKTLFLGLKTALERKCTDKPFKDKVAVRVVDVAPEFSPDLLPADILDKDKTLVAVFVGCSGHGKSTQINAFVSYMIGGDYDDQARIMIIDDRGAKDGKSVTQYITCYRIRPLSPMFEGKTLLIVDTPGYGDNRGIDYDNFVTAAMQVFFQNIAHVNSVVFTCKSNETRTTFLEPIATYVFSLFAQDIRDCLHTLYTFCDAGTPQARATLQALSWPVGNGEIKVNNTAFTVEVDPKNKQIVRDWWRLSVNGQFLLMNMLLSKLPVPTNDSFEVTKDRILLQEKCQIAQKNILSTATQAQMLITDLKSLSKVVGLPPDQKVKVTKEKSVKKPVPEGQATTYCHNCIQTCHDNCAYANDSDKKDCSAMSGENCTVCKGRCHWTKHANFPFLIEFEQYDEWVVAEEIIKKWNEATNNIEGALLGAIETYLKLQENLRGEILRLVELTDKLQKKALRHNPKGLINYIDTLIKAAEMNGAPPEQQAQLITARNTIILEQKIKERGEKAGAESKVLVDVLTDVQKEMQRRMALKPQERAQEEAKSSSLYNDLYSKLSGSVLRRAPAKLKSSALYTVNLKAVVLLVEVLLKDGDLLASLPKDEGTD